MQRILGLLAGVLILAAFACGEGDKVQRPTKESGEIGPSEPQQPERPQPPTIPPGTELWRVKTIGEVRVRPVVGEDGTIYAATDARVYGISPEGKERWFANMSESIRSIYSLTLNADDRIYFVGGSRYGMTYYLYALDPKAYGEEIWHNLVTTKPGGPKPILRGSDNTVYAGAYGFGPEGSERWHRERVIVLGLDTQRGEDVIYAATTSQGGIGDTLCAFTPDGRELWRQACRPQTPVTVATEGTLYIGSTGGHVGGWTVATVMQALAPENGSGKWSVKLNSEINTAPLLDEYDTIYVGTSGGVTATGSDGTELWSFNTDGRVTESPVLDSTGILYFGADRWLYAVWSDDGTEAWSLETEGLVGGVALGPEGVLYFGSSRGYVCAVTR